MLPFLVNAPGLKHLDLQGSTSTSRFTIARLREEWRNLARQSPQISSLESMTISGCGLREDILFKLAAAGDISNLRTLVLAPVHDRNQFGSVGLPERLTWLLHNIWPQPPGRNNWWSCWTSYPLEAESRYTGELFIKITLDASLW